MGSTGSKLSREDKINQNCINAFNNKDITLTKFLLNTQDIDVNYEDKNWSSFCFTFKSCDKKLRMETYASVLGLKYVLDIDSNPRIGLIIKHCSLLHFLSLYSLINEWNTLTFNKDNFDRKELKEIMDLIITKKVNINKKDNNGNTPLHYIANTTDIILAKTLIDAGASLQIKNKDGLTPLDIARKYKLDKMIDFLLHHSLKKDIFVKDIKSDKDNKEELVSHYKEIAEPLLKKDETS